MAGVEADAVRDAAMGKRDADCRRDRGQRGDAGNDLERHARLGERDRLLPAAPEDVRIAALQPDDLEVVPPETDEQLVDLVLVQFLARVDERARGRLVDELRRDEPVVDERLAAAHQVEPARGDQPGIAGTGADEPDGHESDLDTSSSKYSLRAS